VQAAIEVIAAATTNDSSSNNDENTVLYLLPYHPGHHAAYDCMGGYCYLNHAAALASHLIQSTSDTPPPPSQSLQKRKVVAILDVDYHVGNGTAAIFHDNDSVLVVSIHCDPHCDYPFHVGFADDGNDSTVHLPLPPGTTWDNAYRSTLQTGLDAIVQFAHRENNDYLAAVIVSLGLDTYESDPCAIRRAGFGLTAPDYLAMGELMATTLSRNIERQPKPAIVFVQEGGYRMDVIGTAAANVVTSFARHWS
jgi:acetoin utilization deacetylase AcuC-like enzyme